MCLIFVIFALVALVSPGEAKSLEEVEEQLTFFLKAKMEESDVYFKEKMKLSETDLREKMKSSETNLREKIENLKTNENNMKEKMDAMEMNEIAMRKQIFEMEQKIDNLEMKLEATTENAKDVENEKKVQENIIHKITKTEENMFKNNAEEIEYKLGNKEGNNTEERLAYLEELSKLQLRRSCQELAEYGVIMDNHYYVDPDGPLVGSPPIRVWCQFNEDGQAVTEVLHNSEERIDVGQCHEAGCYVRPIQYYAPDFQIQSLIKISENCSQSIEYNCLLAPLQKDGVNLGFWLDKNGAVQAYWDGSNHGSHVCSCFFSEQGCLNHEVTNTTCHCDADVPETKSDVGVITNSSALPVSQLQFGGMDYEIQQASHKLGRLRCWGQANFDAGTSCTAIKKAGEFRSGYFNVKKSQDENSQLVFCKASPGYDDSSEDEVYVESSEDHFQDVETSIDRIKTDISDVGGQVSIMEDSMDDVLKRSDYCSYQDSWDTSNSIITFDKLLVDNNNIPGASMDIGKGEFTAGVSGIYDVSVSLRFRSASDNYLHLRVNGANMAESQMLRRASSPSSNDYSMGGRQMMLQLNAGDTVSLYADSMYYVDIITFCINLAK